MQSVVFRPRRYVCVKFMCIYIFVILNVMMFQCLLSLCCVVYQSVIGNPCLSVNIFLCDALI